MPYDSWNELLLHVMLFSLHVTCSACTLHVTMHVVNLLKYTDGLASRVLHREVGAELRVLIDISSYH